MMKIQRSLAAEADNTTSAIFGAEPEHAVPDPLVGEEVASRPGHDHEKFAA